MDIKETLLDLISQANKIEAMKFLDKLAAKDSYAKVMSDVLEPVLQMVGKKWEKEGTSLAQGYIAAKIAEDVLKKLAAERSSDVQPDTKGPIVIGNIEDDTHSLGRKMVITFMQTDGWEVYDMGNDVLADEFVDKAIEIGAKVIGVSATMYTTARNIKKVRQEIDKRNLTGKIQLAVGGAVFVLRPELVDEVGGDGTARNALDASKLFEDLWERASQEVK